MKPPPFPPQNCLPHCFRLQRASESTGKASSNKPGCDVTFQPLQSLELEYGMFGHLYRTAAAQNDGHLTMNQVLFLHDTELARYCLCAETTTEVVPIGGMTDDVTICGSSQAIGSMDAYGQYCRKRILPTNKNELYENTMYDVAHNKYLCKIQDLNENEALSYEEIVYKTRVALKNWRNTWYTIQKSSSVS